MDLTVYPGHSLRGEVTLPGDKSLSHRAALFAAIAEGESFIDNFLVSGVTRAMLDALTALSVDWQLEGFRLRVLGRGLRGLCLPNTVIDCGNSATTLRLLAGALAAAGLPAVLDGSAGLRSRPMDRIVEPLQRMEVPIRASEGGRAPLRLSARPAGRPLRPIDYRLPVASAQVKSCLLLAALAASGPVTLTEPGPSRDHSERMLRSMGVQVESLLGEDGLGSCVRVQPPAAGLRPLSVSLPGDISSAAFLVVAALVTPGSEILLRNVGLNPTRTGLLEALRGMGACIEILNPRDQSGEPAGDLFVRSSKLRGVMVAGEVVVRMIDEFPAFAAAACSAEGQSEARDAGELRHKESDRVSALCQELMALGANASETPDGFRIQGVEMAGGECAARGDHRLAMALAVAGLNARRPVTIHNSEVIGESFPEFLSVLSGLGARLSLEPQHA